MTDASSMHGFLHSAITFAYYYQWKDMTTSEMDSIVDLQQRWVTMREKELKELSVSELRRVAQLAPGKSKAKYIEVIIKKELKTFYNGFANQMKIPDEYNSRLSVFLLTPSHEDSKPSLSGPRNKTPRFRHERRR